MYVHYNCNLRTKRTTPTLPFMSVLTRKTHELGGRPHAAKEQSISRIYCNKISDDRCNWFSAGRLLACFVMKTLHCSGHSYCARLTSAGWSIRCHIDEAASCWAWAGDASQGNCKIRIPRSLKTANPTSRNLETAWSCKFSVVLVQRLGK